MSRPSPRLPKKHSGFLAALAGFALFLATLLLGVDGRARAAQLDPSIKPETQKAINSLGATVSGKTDRVDQMLKHMGYIPANEDAWRSFPAVRKLETAYLAAQNVDPQGGERMLALLASDLAMQYEAVRYDPALGPLLQSTPAQSTPILFKNSVPPPDPSAWIPPPRIAAAIDSLSRYSGGNALGGTHGVLRDYLGLPPEKAYEILRSSSSDAEAFQRAVNWVPESQRLPRLSQLVAALDRAYEAPRHDKALDVLRPLTPQMASSQDRTIPSQIAFDPVHNQIVASPSHAPPPSVASAPPSVPAPSVSPDSFTQPAAPSSPMPLDMPTRAPALEAESRYAEYMVENYAEPASQSFGAMIGEAEGFGGVVFGNKVYADTRLPAPTQVTFIAADDTPALGRLEVRFKDGSVRNLDLVHLDDAYAAYHIVFSGTGLGSGTVVSPANPGNGIGLVGLADRTDYFDLGPEGIMNDGVRWRVVIHPAIADTNLGWATLMSDSLPIMQAKLLALVKASADSESFEQIQALLQDTPDTWKITDVPLVVKADGTRLFVEKVPEEGKHESPELRQTAFLGIQGFAFNSDDGTTDTTADFSDGFYQLEPVLLRASYDYDRLNQFAQVLAVCRWAKSQGATFLGEPPTPPKVPTPASLIITDQGFATAPDFKPEETKRELLERVQQKSKSITESAPPEARAIYANLAKDINQAATEFRDLERRIEADEEERDRVETQLGDQLKSRPLVLARFNTLETQSDTQTGKYWAAESGSKLETSALQQMQEIQQQETDLLRTNFPDAFDRISTLSKEIDSLTGTSKEARDRWESSIDEEHLKSNLLKAASESVASQYNAFAAQIAQQKDTLEQQKQQLESIQQKLRHLDDRLAKVLKAASPQLGEQYDRLVEEIDQQGELYLSAQAGSQAESDAQQRVEEADEKLDALFKVHAPNLASERTMLEQQVDTLQSTVEDMVKQISSTQAKQDQLFAQEFPQFAYWRALLQRAIDL